MVPAETGREGSRVPRPRGHPSQANPTSPPRQARPQTDSMPGLLLTFTFLLAISISDGLLLFGRVRTESEEGEGECQLDAAARVVSRGEGPRGKPTYVLFFFLTDEEDTAGGVEDDLGCW